MENVQIFELLLTYSLIIKYKQMITSRLKLQKKKKIYKICERRRQNIFARLENVESVE